MTSESIPIPSAEANPAAEKAAAVPDQRTEGQIWYAKLDRFLLFLTAGELGYLILLLVVGIIVGILSATLSAYSGIYRSGTFILLPVLVLVVAMLVNIIVGFTGIVLNILTRHQGYPGTGHLLNWIFIFGAFWIFVILFIAVLPELEYMLPSM